VVGLEYIWMEVEEVEVKSVRERERQRVLE
jgi:hypothetical protein